MLLAAGRGYESRWFWFFPDRPHTRVAPDGMAYDYDKKKIYLSISLRGNGSAFAAGHPLWFSCSGV